MNEHRFLRRIGGLFAALTIVLAPAARCRAADDVSEQRPVQEFDRIRFSGAFRAEITAGAKVAEVVVTADRDLIGRVRTEVHGRTLVVGMERGSAYLHRAPKLSIALPVLLSFSNAGAGSARITGLTGSDVDLSNAGAASIVAAGRAAHESITLDGVGKIDASAVEARDVTVKNNGIGSVTVRASGELTMNVNGVGEIRYSGSPTRVESHVSGIGRIGRL